MITIKKAQFNQRVPFFICSAIIVSLILIGCVPAARYQYQPDKKNILRLQELSAESLLVISRNIEQRFERHSLLFADKDIEKYLNEVLDRLVTPQEKKRYNLNVKVLRSPAVNAFGYPHGTIFITVPLLTKLNNEAQLAAVLGHELIHIVNSHAEKTLERVKERSRKEVQLHPDLAALFDDEWILAGAGAALSSAMRGYSRDLEREADSLGIFRMTEGGYPHEEFLSLLVLLRDYVISENITEQSFFSSHPRITERIRNYYRIVGESDFEEITVCEDCDVFKGRIKKALYDNVRVNISAERYDLAEDQIEKFLALDSCDAEALILYGDFERRISPRSTQFFKWYKRALECDSENAAALRAIGFAYYSIKDFKNAHVYLSRYCEIAPNASDIGTARLMLRMSEEHK
ncbi:MAG: M48 family metalloprotease [Chitinispirillia bacterium]|nr:M48 family metalloprotease [Chitinispirillia bacterium]